MKKNPTVKVCATPAGPCLSAEGPDVRPILAMIGILAVATGVMKLVRVLNDK